MQCDVCKQHSATVFLTQVVEGKVQKVNLCETCAQSKGVTDPTGFDLAELLKGLGKESIQPNSSRGTICPNCGFSQGDFKKTGRLGCSECYEVFSEGLEGLLKAMHSGSSHVGKIPRSRRVAKDQSREMESLQKKLASSIEEENYEEAARIRDEIRQLEARALLPES